MAEPAIFVRRKFIRRIERLEQFVVAFAEFQRITGDVRLVFLRRIPYTMLISDWRPSEDIKQLAFTTPRTVTYTWGANNSQYSSLWVGNDIALGIAGACYHNMDIPLAVNFKGANPYLPRTYFIADGRRDPYGKKVINEGSGPHQKTLHLKPFWAGTQAERDALGLVVYRPSDYSTTTNPTLESHIILPLEGNEVFVNDIYLDDTAVSFAPAVPQVIPPYNTLM